MKKQKENNKPSNFSWTSLLVVLGVVVMLGLWDSGWQPRNAFLAGFLVIFTPMTINTMYRFYERREVLKFHYENAKAMFAAQKIIKEEARKQKMKEHK